MRFLLNSARPKQTKLASATSVSITNARPHPQTVAAKAWGQQCSPNCGCIVRFEVQLSPLSNLASSPMVVHASYHAKRIMTTRPSVFEKSKGVAPLKPLLTSHASQPPSPILTSCTCPALHQLAQQVVDHMPGKSLQTLKNETDLGVVGTRSSAAFRHTILKENVMPSVRADERQWSIFIEKSLDTSNDKTNEFSSTKPYFHCYDLVEDAVLSLLHERQIGARKESAGDCFSPTLGGYFAMYSASKRNKPPFGKVGVDEKKENDTDSFSGQHSMHSDNAGWLRASPSSYFLFGEDHAAVSMLNFLQHARDVILTRLFGKTEGDADARTNEVGEQRPTTTYLRLLDMYGNATIDEQLEDDKVDDWLSYVDQTQKQG
ncbi:hypothetical protein HJC23_006911 [Cyclotella cryptica]|uniref:Uncharacterized protein n=1 Tax=Cyclotella cryptica TaxID=29204 RepID=A0ABD3QBY0_9STRA|eukprot:CCRYP_006755-RA/>CCRYP_006755-RA protein AED:0.14 eAED:0.14 QI:0/-1/0/1/-1/1/1/0/374